MFLSVFDIFKIGVGPSSSHTNAPMIAANRFIKFLKDKNSVIPGAELPQKISCTLYGSLAFTGKGHGTDRAILLGLGGLSPETFQLETALSIEKEINKKKTINIIGLDELHFDPSVDIIFDYGSPLKGHTNGMIFKAFDKKNNLYTKQTYYSIGGGFVLTEDEFFNPQEMTRKASVPFPFSTADEMLSLAKSKNLTISELKLKNELVFLTHDEIKSRLLNIWTSMNDSIERGIKIDGILPGGLNLRRRAQKIHQTLLEESRTNYVAPHVINDWISVYAIAVNEENAAGGKIVTAPTNGATIRYFLDHVPGATYNQIDEFLLTASAIGGLIKSNASISGAEVGCQGEIGSAAAMAAAGLCAVLGGSPEQVENAAEIALEHHLGMTCDPIKGLVQAPCIERNGLGAIKAVSAASLALRGDGQHLVSLDACIKTMLETGKDMMTKYKETSLGGLAVNFTEC